MLFVKDFTSMDDEEFKEYVRELQVYLKNTEVPYKTLQNYARKVYPMHNEKSRVIYRLVSKKMKLLLEQGYVSKKRIPNTGIKVEERRFYEDNAKNRKLGRVGQPYIYSYWKNAEMRDIKHRIKRPKKATREESEPKKPNMWIESVKAARKELVDEGEDLKFVTIRKEISDPDDPKQALGLKLYQRAMTIYKT